MYIVVLAYITRDCYYNSIIHDHVIYAYNSPHIILSLIADNVQSVSSSLKYFVW